MGPLTDLSAAALAGLVARREVSAAEVVEAHLRRIDEVDPAINAVVQLDAERALNRARSEPKGPLGGVPFTVKDNLEVAGLAMAIGVPERAHVVPVGTATAVARLEAAGAILLGKTNCPPWGGGIETDNPVYGRTNNPHDLARTAGGSSGGEAAIVAAGGSPCGLGTDSGASVRLPAHFCGVAALKPTAGRVPVSGVIDDEGQIGALSDPRTQIGPIARTAEDLALILHVIEGPDGLDAGVPARGDAGRGGDPRGLAGVRVALQRETEFHSPDTDTLHTLEQAAEALRAAGAILEDADLPPGGHALTMEIWQGPTSTTLRRWDAYRTAMLRFGERYDLILSPVFPTPAPRHGETSRPIDPTSFTTPHNLTGWPAATVPAGTAANGLPIGVQLVAHPWHDELALAAAHRIQQGTRTPQRTSSATWTPST